MMMNTSTFSANNLHQDHNTVTVTHAQHSSHAAPPPPPLPAAGGGSLSYQLHAAGAPLQMSTSLLGGATHSTATLFDPRHSNPLEKSSYYTTAAPMTTAGTRFYTTAAAVAEANPVTATAPQPQQHHQHQHANTILITNNFGGQPQQFATATQAQATQAQRNASAIGGAQSYANSGSNIRIVTTLPNALPQNVGSQTLQQQPQHVYNVVKEHDEIMHQQIYQPAPQPHFSTHSQHLTALLPQHFAQQHAANAMQLQLPPVTQQYYLPAPATDTSTQGIATGANSTKVLSALPSNSDDGTGTLTLNTQAATVTSAPQAATSSTVVLDRINICINNHYSDSMASSSSSSATSSSIDTNTATLSVGGSSHAQQPSPIIPAIHHKTVLDPLTGVSGGLHIDAYASNDSTLVIDEPDSTTTTPHTPPTTPENSTPPPLGVSNSGVNTTTTITQTSPSATNKEAQATVKNGSSMTSRPAFAAITQCIELEDDSDEEEGEEEEEQKKLNEVEKENKATEEEMEESIATLTAEPQETQEHGEPTEPSAQVANLLTPPSPEPPAASLANSASSLQFDIGEDVFIRRDDGRFYLGTVIESARHSEAPHERRYLVRFDDKSELWGIAGEMKKLGGGCSTGPAAGETAGNSGGAAAAQMCVACKRAQLNDVIETCERCGRGYHRNCTSETTTGSGIWWCKRCNKAMKVMPNSNSNSVCRQLPYHVEALKWDDKHRVNEEQIYCYCGKTGQFDNNMLQCCKCQNWFHTQCMNNFAEPLLRGDGFFVFCCSICNEGEEFLRRLQMSWVDLLHLTLYNLSVMKKHHKFHHLVNDIWPFISEKRSSLPVPKEWIEMPQAELLKTITSALKEHSERFICGRECKRDLCYYALRTNGPPLLPKIQIRESDVLCDELLTQTLKLKLDHVQCNEKDGYSENQKPALATDRSTKADVYEFRIEDDEKFTSDDEIPIKHIIEKVRKSKGTPPGEKVASMSTKSKSKKSSSLVYEKIELNDENANDANCSLSSGIINKQQSPKKPSNLALMKTNNKSSDAQTAAGDKPLSAVGVSALPAEKSSRKRKAFTLSKTYKEIAAEAAAKRYDSSRICDSSSDENSSSSRGTSLDVIIPPPKNFLGPNNPFRIVTPKKNGHQSTAIGGSGSGVKALNFSRSGMMIKNSIFNTTTLDFSSKLAALKNAGMFPNLSTSNLAKAAGQPRTVRTIKRRLSAKDITIGPNQEVRRRRTRRPSSNVEVISTTTINPIPTNFFSPLAKDFFTANLSSSTTTLLQAFKQQQQPPPATPNSSSSASSSPPASVTSSLDSHPEVVTGVVLTKPTTHGRRLRQRPQKNSPGNSRRSSISSASTSSNSSSNVTLAALQQAANANNNNNNNSNCASTSGNATMQDLKQSVKEYFGAVNRIESGEQFSIRAKRQLANGQTQYLVEWGEVTSTTVQAAVTT